MPSPVVGFNDTLGIRFLGGEQGHFQLELDIGHQHLHEVGGVHGGVYLSLLDTVMSRAVRSLFHGVRYAPTINIQVSFFRPIENGIIRAEGRVVNQSRRTAFVEGSLLSSSKKLLARGSATFFLLDDLSENGGAEIALMQR